MKMHLAATLSKTIWLFVLTFGQIVGGILLGIGTVIASQFLADRPGTWECGANRVETMERLDIRFDIEITECIAGGHHIQTKMAINASRAGERAPTKVFEYLVLQRQRRALEIEQVDAHTVRVVMPGKDEAGQGIIDARYMGLRTWQNVTFVYGSR